MKLKSKQKHLMATGIALIVLSPVITYFGTNSATGLYCLVFKPFKPNTFSWCGLYEGWIIGLVLPAISAATGSFLIYLALRSESKR